MPRFKNVSPLGALDLPLLGRVIEQGEEFELDDSVAGLLAGQEGTFEPVDAAAKRLPSPIPTEPAELQPVQPEPVEPPPVESPVVELPAPADSDGQTLLINDRGAAQVAVPEKKGSDRP